VVCLGSSLLPAKARAGARELGLFKIRAVKGEIRINRYKMKFDAPLLQIFNLKAASLLIHHLSTRYRSQYKKWQGRTYVGISDMVVLIVETVCV
jgi:hypothetical protein